MTTIDYTREAGRARTLRQRVNLDQLDYRRELARLASLGIPQRQLSKVLGISQPSLSSALKTAEKVSPTRPGFSGADPYEVCLRYSVGELSREQLIAELQRWDYVVPEPREHDHFDDLRFDTPGSFSDVERALNDGLIDGEAYDTVLEATADESR